VGNWGCKQQDKEELTNRIIDEEMHVKNALQFFQSRKRRGTG